MNNTMDENGIYGVLRRIGNAIPRKMKESVRTIKSRTIPFPHSVDREFAKVYFELMKMQWWTIEQIRDYQCKKLKEIIHFAYREVPYYRRIFREIGIEPNDIRTPEDLSSLPILTKEEVRQHFREMFAKNYKKYAPSPGYTSGSTGTTLTFSLTHLVKHYEKAFGYRHWKSVHFIQRDRSVVLRGDILTEDPSAVAPFVKKGKELFLSSFHLSDVSLPEYAGMIKEFQPAAIRAYPSALAILTRYFKKASLSTVPGLKVILTSSESLLSEIRREAEEFWQCPVIDWYGNGERIAAIGECEHGSYHIQEDYSYVELEPTDSPRHRRIVGTTYYNLAMPLIRYDIQDIVTVHPEDDAGICSCGRAFRKISSIDGRIEGIVITPDRRYVGRLDAAFKYSPGIALAQIIQQQIDYITIKIVKGKSFCDNDMERLNRELRLRLGEKIAIHYEFVPDIPRTSAGKLNFVISDVKPELL